MRPVGCRGAGCTALIVWARTVTGRAMPIAVDRDGNPPEAPDGNIALYTQADGEWLARVLRKDEQPVRGERRTVAHFTDCPGWKR